MLEDNIIHETRESLSRRNFLVKAGALTAGMAVAGGILGSFAGKADAAVSMPIPYGMLDVEAARRYGYEGYKTYGGCMAGGAFGLLKAIQDQTGAHEDWSKFDIGLFAYGAGGINGWGTLCGALNGTLFIMALAVGKANMAKYGNELINWYTKFPFPSATLKSGTPSFPIPTALNGDALNNRRVNCAKITTVSDSPLCHASVSKWIKECGNPAVTPSDTAKADRCGRLTGDVAAKAATILNQALAATFVSTSKATIETNYCMTCHAPTNVPSNEGYLFPNNKDDEQGKMPCTECHTDETAHRSMMSDENADDCAACHTL